MVWYLGQVLCEINHSLEAVVFDNLINRYETNQLLKGRKIEIYAYNKNGTGVLMFRCPVSRVGNYIDKTIGSDEGIFSRSRVL